MNKLRVAIKPKKLSSDKMKNQIIKVDNLIRTMFNKDGSWKRKPTKYFQNKAKNLLNSFDIYETIGSDEYHAVLIIAFPDVEI